MVLQRTEPAGLLWDAGWGASWMQNGFICSRCIVSSSSIVSPRWYASLSIPIRPYAALQKRVLFGAQPEHQSRCDGNTTEWFAFLVRSGRPDHASTFFRLARVINHQPSTLVNNPLGPRDAARRPRSFQCALFVPRDPKIDPQRPLSAVRMFVPPPKNTVNSRAAVRSCFCVRDS
jgi:hypothetical protein